MREVGYVFGRSRATGGYSQKAIWEKSPKGTSGLLRCCEVTSALDTLQDHDSIPWLGVQTRVFALAGSPGASPLAFICKVLEGTQQDHAYTRGVLWPGITY